MREHSSHQAISSVHDREFSRNLDQSKRLTENSKMEKARKSIEERVGERRFSFWTIKRPAKRSIGRVGGRRKQRGSSKHPRAGMRASGRPRTKDHHRSRIRGPRVNRRSYAFDKSHRSAFDKAIPSVEAQSNETRLVQACFAPEPSSSSSKAGNTTRTFAREKRRKLKRPRLCLR